MTKFDEIYEMAKATGIMSIVSDVETTSPIEELEAIVGEDASPEKLIAIWKDTLYSSNYYDEAKEMVDNDYSAQATNLMDDDIREHLHEALAPCDDITFLTAYMEEHKHKYGENFTI